MKSAVQKRSTPSQHIHFIGIGGIGVSALARHYVSRGWEVSGSDLTHSEITDDLARVGIHVIIGPHKAQTLPQNTSLVVYTAAVKSDNPELKAAQKRKIAIKMYAQALGALTQEYRTITVSGSHGKTTTTALSALVLEQGRLDPTVIVGAKIKEFGNTNYRSGCGSFLVLEADEWNKSFLNYHPEIAIVTNIDREHVDTYPTVKDIERAFTDYLSRVPGNGAIIANADDERTHRVARGFGKHVIWYSRSGPHTKSVQSVLKIPGAHNVSNALAAFTLGRTLGVPESDILRALGRFTGAWRRFEFKGMVKGAYVFTDYAHHPREIIATLAAARERFPAQHIHCIYQPHQYQRLQALWDDFLSCFDEADHVALVPVYDVVGRETAEAKAAVNSQKLVRELVRRGKDAIYLPLHRAAKTYLRTHTKPGDVVLVMGAGDIYEITNGLM